MKHTGRLLQVMLLALACLNTAIAEEQFKDVEIKSIKAGDGVYMLTGKAVILVCPSGMTGSS